MQKYRMCLLKTKGPIPDYKGIKLIRRHYYENFSLECESSQEQF